MSDLNIAQSYVPDSCTVFAPKRPTTRADLAKVIAEEARIPDWEALVEKIAAEAEITRPECNGSDC